MSHYDEVDTLQNAYAMDDVDDKRETHSYGDVENKKILNVNYEVKTLDLQFKTEQRYLIKNDSDFNLIEATSRNIFFNSYSNNDLR